MRSASPSIQMASFSPGFGSWRWRNLAGLPVAVASWKPSASCRTISLSAVRRMVPLVTTTSPMNVFEGDVVVTKGTIRLTADKLIVRQDAEGFQLATATGKPAKFRQRQDPKPGEKEAIWIEGEALRIELDDRNQKIELFDKARVNRGGDEVAGDYIFVDQRADF